MTPSSPFPPKPATGWRICWKTCGKYAEESPFLFPEDVTTDQPERQVMAEIIREKLLWCLDREVPHGTAVEITKFSERDSGIIDIDATIYCEKASHKGIIIGKNGAMLKKISSMARADCEKFMGTKVFLTDLGQGEGKLAGQRLSGAQFRLQRIISSGKFPKCGKPYLQEGCL